MRRHEECRLIKLARRCCSQKIILVVTRPPHHGEGYSGMPLFSSLVVIGLRSQSVGLRSSDLPPLKLGMVNSSSPALSRPSEVLSMVEE